MDLGSLIGALVAVLGFAATVAGGFIAWGKLSARVNDNAGEIVELRKAVEEAQKTARAVDGLAAAVEHLAQRFTDQLRHMVETLNITNDHTKTTLAEIKDELKLVRSNAVSIETARRRRGASA